MTLQSYELSEVCKSELILNAELFFSDWLVSSLIADDFQNVVVSYKTHNQDFKDHVDQITNYLQVFTSKLSLMNKMLVLNFKIKMNNFIGLVRTAAGLPSEDPFEKKSDWNNLIRSFLGQPIPFGEDLVTQVRHKTLTANLIFSFRTYFSEEYEKIEGLESSGMKTEYLAMKTRLTTLLYLILGFTEGDQAGVNFLGLDEENRKLLQTFYDVFHNIIDPAALKLKVISKKSGGELIIRENHNFLIIDLFKGLVPHSVAFRDILVKDESLTTYSSKIELLLFHQLGPHAEFNWPKFQIFNKPRYADINDQTEGAEGKIKRKLIYTYISIYKVYTIARKLDLFKAKSAGNVGEVAQILFDWIVEGKEYAKAKSGSKSSGKSGDSEAEDSVDQFKKIKELLPDNEFAHSFMPMLVELCSLIKGCDLDKHAKRAVIVVKFIELGFYNDLFKSVSFFPFPPHIKEDIQKDTIVKSTNSFLTELNIDESSKSISAKILNDPFGGRIGKVEVSQRRIARVKGFQGIEQFVFREQTKKLTDVIGVDKKFDATFRTKLIATEGGNERVNDVLIDTYLSTVDKSQSVKTKTLGYLILLRFLMTLQEDKRTEIVKKIIKIQSKEIRNGVDHPSFRGLRNFLIYSTTSNQRYVPLAYSERYQRNMDLAYVVFVFTFDKIQLSKTAQNAADTTKYSDLFAMYQTILLKKNSGHLNSLGDTDVDMVGNMVKAATSQKSAEMLTPYFIEKLRGFKVLYALRGFFEYYGIVEEDKTQNGFESVKSLPYVDFHRVYTQFYAFLIHIRNEVIFDTDNPYQFVLDQLEQCLAMTKSIERFIRPSMEDKICKFSHRKYAEMLFFYKAFLKHKQILPIDLDAKEPTAFNVHTRTFLGFTVTHSEYRNLLTTECLSNPVFPICISKSIFDLTIRYISDMETKETIVLNEISRLLADSNTGPTKLNIINGLEAAYLVAKKSTPVSYAKLEYLFQSSYGNVSPLKKALVFESQDVEFLTEYLIRTYKKLEVTEIDDNLSQIIQSVLISAESDVQSFAGALMNYFYYNEVFFISYMKLFLQYTVKDKHFKYFAQLMIQHKVSVELIKMNDMEVDQFFLSFGPLTKSLTCTDTDFVAKGVVLVRNHLTDRYDQILKLSAEIARNSVKKEMEDEVEFDLLNELLEEDSSVSEQSSKKSKESFAKSAKSIQSVNLDESYTSVKDYSTAQIEVSMNSATSNLNDQVQVAEVKKVDIRVYRVEVEITAEHLEEGGIVVRDATVKKDRMSRGSISGGISGKEMIPSDVLNIALRQAKVTEENWKERISQKVESIKSSQEEDWEDENGGGDDEDSAVDLEKVASIMSDRSGRSNFSRLRSMRSNSSKRSKPESGTSSGNGQSRTSSGNGRSGTSSGNSGSGRHLRNLGSLKGSERDSSEVSSMTMI